MPERHLGLVQAGEQENLPQILAEAAAFVSAHVDLDALRAAAAGTLADATAPAKSPRPVSASRWPKTTPLPLSIRICWPGGARPGPRFCRFPRWRMRPRTTRADVCWLPGGYPELHAGKLAAPQSFRDGLQRFAQTQTGAWRMRGLYGDGRRTGRQRRHTSRDGGAFGAGDLLCQAQDAPWLPQGRPERADPRPCAQAKACADMNFTMPRSLKNPTRRWPASPTAMIWRSPKPDQCAEFEGGGVRPARFST